MVGIANSIKGVLSDFLTSILPTIFRETIREALIKIHLLIIGNLSYVTSNLGLGRNGHPMLTMNMEEYLAQTAHVFVPPYNPVYYPPKMGTAQEKALGEKRFRQNQALFCRWTTIYGAIKNQEKLRRCINYSCHQSWIKWQDLTINGPRDASTYLQIVQGDWRNWPQRKFIQNYGDL